jgi:hypothetical protein
MKINLLTHIIFISSYVYVYTTKMKITCKPYNITQEQEEITKVYEKMKNETYMLVLTSIL